MRTLDLSVLLQRIEAQLVTADQLEYKKMRFKLAKQKATENPWKYEHHLTTYYQAAQTNQEEKFVEVFKRAYITTTFASYCYCTTLLDHDNNFEGSSTEISDQLVEVCKKHP